MITINNIIGNICSDEWRVKLQGAIIDYLELDRWSAQKSRLIVEKAAERYCISLNRRTHLKDGDILLYDEKEQRALVVEIEETQVMVIKLDKIALRSRDELIRTSVEIGHAIGNQHWPAVVKEKTIYVPLTLDKKVMESVMRTHNFADIEIVFQEGKDIIPYLSPHDIRYLFAGSEHNHHG